MSNLNPINPAASYNGSSLSTPPVDTSKGPSYDSVEKKEQQEVEVQKESPKKMTAKRFSTDSDTQKMAVIKQKETEEVSKQELPQETQDALETREGLEAFANVLQDYAKNVHQVGLKFAVHEDTGRTVIRVIDENTEEVVKEVPPQELLDLAAKLEQMIGTLVDEKV